MKATYITMGGKYQWVGDYLCTVVPNDRILANLRMLDGMGKAQNLRKAYPLAELTFPSNETVHAWVGQIAAKTDVPVKKG